VLVGERFLTRVDVGRVRRLGASVHVQFRFRMWKPGADGEGDRDLSQRAARDLLPSDAADV
jgi:hypothetical protein